jgi:hypothetical protein
MGYYQQVCGIFKFESINTAYQKKAFHSIINEKKDVFVNLTTGAGNYLFIKQGPVVRKAFNLNGV